MEIVKIISAVGFGAIATKIIDILWVQPFLEKRERRNWLREKRFQAYTALAANLLSFGLSSKPENDPFKHLAEISPSILLTSDDDFCEQIYSFIAKRSLMFSIQDGKSKSNEDPGKLYYELVEESKELVIKLKKHMHDQKI